MNLEQAAQQYKPVPLKVLKRMVSEGLLTEPLDEKDQHALQLLSRIWSDEWYVARMNMSFKSEKRALMLAFPNFGKIERYILCSYLPKEHGPRYRVSVRDVANNLRAFSTSSTRSSRSNVSVRLPTTCCAAAGERVGDCTFP